MAKIDDYRFYYGIKDYKNINASDLIKKSNLQHNNISANALLRTIYIQDTCCDIEVYFSLEGEIDAAHIQRAKEMFLGYWHF